MKTINRFLATMACAAAGIALLAAGSAQAQTIKAGIGEGACK